MLQGNNCLPSKDSQKTVHAPCPVLALQQHYVEAVCYVQVKHTDFQGLYVPAGRQLPGPE